MVNLNSDVKLYVITHVPCTFLTADIIIPIATNKALGDSMNIISSEDGYNVAPLNNLLAEYSTLYWGWKNDITSRYISFFHNRRYLMVNDSKTTFDQNVETAESCGFESQYIKNLFNNFDIILPKAQRFSQSVYTQYCMCHEQVYIDKLLEIINRKYPEYSNSFYTAFRATSGYFCNLFIMRRIDFNQYMSFIFDIFDEIKPYLHFSNQIKPFAYLAERIFTGYVQYLKDIKGFRVKEVPVLYVSPDQCVIKESTGM